MSKVFACANTADAGKRHACYDALGPELKAAEAARGGTAAVAPAPAPASQPTQTQKVEAFGSPGPAASPLTATTVEPPKTKSAKPKADKEVDKVKLPVKSIQKAGDGRLRFTMENGQVWKQADDTGLPGLGNGPWTAEIKKGAIGTFMLSINGRAAVRVVREQ